MSTSQLVLMILSFVGMFGFAGVAVWLWTRQHRAPPAAPIRIAAPAVAEPEPNPRPEPRPEPEPVEVTEFVALPGRREDDSPQPAGADEIVERTEFIAAPLELTGRGHAKVREEAPERTEFLDLPARPELEERTAFVLGPEVEERTAFIEPPPSLATPSSFEPPPSFAAPSSFEPPPSLATPPSFAAPKHDHAGQLSEHFELAVASLAQLERCEDQDQATALHGHLEVLASAPIEPLLGLLHPVLATPDPAGIRCAAAWLALLHHKSWPAKRGLPELLAKLDERGRAEGLRALASWDDPRAPGLAAAGLELTSNEAERAQWLELFADRGWDPGDAAIDRALGSTDPRLLIAGLRLAGSRPAERVRARVSAQLFAADPAVRIEAIETALIFAEQSAWLVCRQLARNPAVPRAAELVGLLGSEGELAALCQAASVGGSASLLWGLGLSGRAVALEVCAAALDDDELRSAAVAALALACGREFGSATEAREWLGSRASSGRMIGGSPRTLEALARTLADTDSIALRRAIARELRIRARGRVVSSPRLRPRAWRRQVASLLELDVDLDRDFPWHG